VKEKELADNGANVGATVGVAMGANVGGGVGVVIGANVGGGAGVGPVDVEVDAL